MRTGRLLKRVLLTVISSFMFCNSQVNCKAAENLMLQPDSSENYSSCSFIPVEAIPKLDKQSKKDSAKTVNCFKRLIFEGYNASDYKEFINNNYYGKYPEVEGVQLQSEPQYVDLYANDAKNKPLAKKIFNMSVLDQAVRW